MFWVINLNSMQRLEHDLIITDMGIDEILPPTPDNCARNKNNECENVNF